MIIDDTACNLVSSEWSRIYKIVRCELCETFLDVSHVELLYL